MPWILWGPQTWLVKYFIFFCVVKDFIMSKIKIKWHTILPSHHPALCFPFSLPRVWKRGAPVLQMGALVHRQVWSQPWSVSRTEKSNKPKIWCQLGSPVQQSPRRTKGVERVHRQKIHTVAPHQESRVSGCHYVGLPSGSTGPLEERLCTVGTHPGLSGLVHLPGFCSQATFVGQMAQSGLISNQKMVLATYFTRRLRKLEETLQIGYCLFHKWRKINPIEIITCPVDPLELESNFLNSSQSSLK